MIALLVAWAALSLLLLVVLAREWARLNLAALVAAADAAADRAEAEARAAYNAWLRRWRERVGIDPDEMWRKNMWTLIAEERLALSIVRPGPGPLIVAGVV
jgi:hypothetical protein